MKQLAGNIGGKMATKRQLGGNLGHLKANLRPNMARNKPGPRNARSHLSSAKAYCKEASGNLTQRAGLKAAAGFIASRIPPGRVEG